MHIMIPKLKLVWSGEVIVANDLVAMYKSKVSQDEDMRSMDSVRDVVSVPSVPLRAIVQDEIENNCDLTRTRTFIRETKTIPRRLLVKILRISGVLKKYISTSTQGKVLSKSEWESLKKESHKFNVEMDGLMFSWECIGNESDYIVEEDSDVSVQPITPDISDVGTDHSMK